MSAKGFKFNKLPFLFMCLVFYCCSSDTGKVTEEKSDSFKEDQEIETKYGDVIWLDKRGPDRASGINKAAEDGDIKKLKKYLDKRPDYVNRLSKYYGESPLNIAVDYYQEGAVEFLIARGADVNLLSREKRTPLHHTSLSSCNYYSIGAYYCDIKKELATKNPALSCAKILVENGADVDARDSFGMTALHLAAICGNTDLVKYLVEKNASIDVKDNEGSTPLYYAKYSQFICVSAYENKEMIDFLVKKGAKLEGFLVDNKKD